MNCPGCGAALATDARFCQVCGHAVPVAATPLQGQPTTTGVAAAQSTSGMAIASLVLGIVGLIVFFWLIPSVLAIIFGGIGLGATRNSAKKGKGMAIAGLVMGIVGVSGTIVVWIAAWSFVAWY